MTGTRAAVLAHYGETDERVNAGMADLEQAMAGKTFERTIHPGVGHAFNNDTGPAYDEQAAIDAWSETLQWFAQHLARGNGG
jgi:carboxymethylenebutenolidase